MDHERQVKNYLKGRHALVLDEWLSACIAYIKESQPNVNLNELKELVWEQWLVADLREISVPSLPRNLRNITKTTLNGSYALQLMSCRDIATPSYAQLQKLRKVDNDNAEVSASTQGQFMAAWEPKSKRVLQLELTDGTQTVNGLEYKPLNIDVNITPGIKVLIYGNVVCRKGVMLLKENHIKVLGGEVDELMEENAPEKVLEKCLRGSSTQVSATSNNVWNATQSQAINRNRNSATGGTAASSRNTGQYAPTPRSTPSGYNNRTPQTANNNRPPLSNGHRSTIFVDDRRPDPFDDSLGGENITEWPDDDDDLFLDEDIEKQLEVLEQTHATPGIRRQPVEEPMETSTSAEFEADETSSGREASQTNDSFDFLKPWVYLPNIHELSDGLNIREFIVRGYISTFMSRLESKDDQWHLIVKIDDGLLPQEVRISDKLLTKLIGFDAKQLSQLKQQTVKDPSLKQKIKEGLDGCQRKLINHAGLMKLEVDKDNQLIVTEFLEMTQQHMKELKDRVQQDQELV